MKLLAFAASNSKKSINKQLVTYAASLVDGAEVEVLDLNDYELPLFSVDKEGELGHPELAKAFMAKVAASDAVMISFAEHNGSYSAAYKNLFDWSSRLGPKVFQDKLMVLLATSPGPSGGASVLAAATGSAPYFAGQVKASLAIPSFYENFDVERGTLRNEELNTKLIEAVGQLRELAPAPYAHFLKSKESSHNISTVVEHQSRSVERIIEGVATSDGAGVKLTRVLSGKLQKRLDPFLLLDAFGSDAPDDYIAGFPDHPHRGFETVTYMLSGRMRHRDSAGHEGLLENGGVQWMTAGRGVIHSEIPEQEDGLMEGFQLWLNLPAKNKMMEPWYRDFPSGAIPEYVTPQGVTVRVIAGSSNGVAGAVAREITEPLYLDIHVPAGAEFSTALPATHNAFIYVYRGAVTVDGVQVETRRMGILSNPGSLGNASGADGVTLSATEDARLILVAGKPLNEPIVQYGPFVMNAQQEINQALNDFGSGRFA